MGPAAEDFLVSGGALLEPEGAVSPGDEKVPYLAGACCENHVRGFWVEKPGGHLEISNGVAVLIVGPVVVVFAGLPVVVIELNEGPLGVVFWFLIDDPAPDFFFLVGDNEAEGVLVEFEPSRGDFEAGGVVSLSQAIKVPKLGGGATTDDKDGAVAGGVDHFFGATAEEEGREDGDV